MSAPLITVTYMTDKADRPVEVHRKDGKEFKRVITTHKGKFELIKKEEEDVRMLPWEAAL